MANRRVCRRPAARPEERHAATGSKAVHWALPDNIWSEFIVEHLDAQTRSASLLPTCRRQFCLGMCHPSAFKTHVLKWQACALQGLGKDVLDQDYPPATESFRSALEDLQTAFDVQATWIACLESLAAAGQTLFRHVDTQACLCMHAIRMQAVVDSDGEGDGEAADADVKQHEFLGTVLRELIQRMEFLTGVVDTFLAQVPEADKMRQWASWLESTTPAAQDSSDRFADCVSTYRTHMECMSRQLLHQLDKAGRLIEVLRVLTCRMRGVMCLPTRRLKKNNSMTNNNLLRSHF